MKLCALFVPIMAYVQGLDRLEMPQASEVNDALQRLIKQAKDTALSEEMSVTRFHEALFPVIAWADERLSLLPAWHETRPWRAFMLQRKFFSTSLAGVQFFERLEKLEKNDQELREVYVTCLALGFVGRYSINPNAPELAELLQHQYKLLRPEQARKTGAANATASLFPESYRLVTNSVRHRHWRVGSRMFWLFVILVPALLLGALAYWFDSLLSIQASEITRRLP